MAKNEVSWGNYIYVIGGKKSSELVIKTICSHLKENASHWSENNIQHLKKCMEKL